MGKSPNILYARSRRQDESIFYFKLSKTTLDFISGPINLNYTFNMSFKVSSKVKAIINGGFMFQFHDYVHSKILPMEYDCHIFSKYLIFRIRNFEILGFSHLEFKILGISSKIPSTSKTCWLFLFFPNVWNVTRRRNAGLKK